MFFQNIFILATFAITQISAAPAPATRSRLLPPRSAETTTTHSLKSRQDVSALETALSERCPGDYKNDAVAEKCVADYLLFVADMPTFQSYRNANIGSDYLDWASDGCSVPGAPDNLADYPLGFPFFEACLRHDFGYRNFGDEGRCGERDSIDNKFKSDLFAKCNEKIQVPPQPKWYEVGKMYEYLKKAGHLGVCQGFAMTYYKGVSISAERFCHAKRKRWLEEQATKH